MENGKCNSIVFFFLIQYQFLPLDWDFMGKYECRLFDVTWTSVVNIFTGTNFHEKKKKITAVDWKVPFLSTPDCILYLYRPTNFYYINIFNKKQCVCELLINSFRFILIKWLKRVVERLKYIPIQTDRANRQMFLLSFVFRCLHIEWNR